MYMNLYFSADYLVVKNIKVILCCGEQILMGEKR